MADNPRVQRAAEVLLRDYDSQYSAAHLTWRDFADLATQVLEAADGHPVDETVNSGCPRCSGQNPNICSCLDRCGHEFCAGGT